MSYTKREQIVVDHAKSAFALERMQLADGTAVGISAAVDLLSGSESSNSYKGDAIDAVQSGIKEVGDITNQAKLRWVQAEPIFERIDADLVAQGYPPAH